MDFSLIETTTVGDNKKFTWFGNRHGSMLSAPLHTLIKYDKSGEFAVNLSFEEGLELYVSLKDKYEKFV